MHQLVFRQSFNPPQFCADGSLNPKHKHKSGFSCVFINDMVVLSKTAAEHKQHLQAVLSELRDHKLLIKASKCVWGQTGRPYLGYIIGKDGALPKEGAMSCGLAASHLSAQGSAISWSLNSSSSTFRVMLT